MRPHCVILAEELNFPEGPAFDTNGTLWCVELHGGNLVRLHADSIYRFPVNGAPCGLAFDREGRGWFCDSEQNAIRRFDNDPSGSTTIINTIGGEPLNKPNDLLFDMEGNLLFTCPGNSRNEPSGYVCCLRSDGQLSKIAEGFFFPNGLALMNEGTTLVLAESYRQRLWKGEWNSQSCIWTDPAPWVITGGRPGPDGMALDIDGVLYVAVYGDGAIKAVGPDGCIIRSYELPGANPTNVALDPNGELGLVVTETEKGLLLSLPEVGHAIL